jgi:hypothetical protein
VRSKSAQSCLQKRNEAIANKDAIGSDVKMRTYGLPQCEVLEIRVRRERSRIADRPLKSGEHGWWRSVWVDIDAEIQEVFFRDTEMTRDVAELTAMRRKV